MLVTKDFPNKEFRSKQELHAELRANKKGLYASKMLTKKRCDSHPFTKGIEELSTNKASEGIKKEVNKLAVKLVANSCGIFDSHHDVHINGCWNKTANENSTFYHIKEHEISYNNIIDYFPKKSVERLKILGKTTDCLVVDSIIDKDLSKDMFELYKKGLVFFHSVGMFYVKGKLILCIDSDDPEDAVEKANYDKYVSQVINREEMEVFGYFWAVLEAKAIEVSAVPLASNPHTPTLLVEEIEDEPTKVTQSNKEPSNDTQNEVLKSILNIKIK